MALCLYGSTALVLYCELYACTVLHYSFSTPVHLYAFMPLHLYTSSPVLLYTSTPLHLYTSTPLRLYTSTPLCLYTSTPLHLYTSTPLHVYTSTPLCLYTSTETVSPGMMSQPFPVSRYWSHSFVPRRKRNLTLLVHQNTGKENRYQNIFCYSYQYVVEILLRK